MLLGILVTIVVFLLLIALIAVLLVLRSRNNPSIAKNPPRKKNILKSVENVGFDSSVDQKKEMKHAAHTRSTSKVHNTTGRASEQVRSRFVALGVLAAAVFGSLGVKIWSMQMLSSEHYKDEAARNKYTTVNTPAPRGFIFDSKGKILVKNRSVLTVLAEPSVIKDDEVMRRLSVVLGIPLPIVRMRLLDQSSGAQSLRVISRDARKRDAAFIAEHSDAFSGISVQTRTMREYPFGALCAHALGYTGNVSEDELKSIPKNRNIKLGDVVGKSGIEAYYDNILSGEHGQRRVLVNSQGTVVQVESDVAPTKGNDVYLTIRAAVQYVADTKLAEAIAPDGIIGKAKGVAGSVVAMDVEDGSILAMASYPTFDPTAFNGGITQDIWDLYSTPESFYPLFNRVTQGTYPAASTYKAFTSLAGLKHGFADGAREWICSGSWDGFGSGDWQNCWLLSGHGPVTLHEGIVVSCDIVFYEIAKNFFYAGKTQGGTISDTAMQEEIAEFGFGKKTGIDLSGEDTGRIPTPEWKAQHWSDVPTEGVWRGGDLSNMSIGQGDVLVTPLQIAVGYGAVATGKLVKPHLLKEVKNAQGTTVIHVDREITSIPDVREENYRIVREALGEVSLSDSGIARVLSEYGVDVKDIGSKTGTGEVAGKGDAAWFVCYYPLDAPKYVVACCMEEAGAGALAAGPVAASVLGALAADERGDLDEVRSVPGSTGKSVERQIGKTSRTD